ncbi:Relaxase/Mobilisation nuclease domain-containing protein [Dyadobacter koreensis]|uniref:Relaxase/Mobilisation nuclease domain-containing protein n=1 Tax=Dyadobacter koreensis TaxID=408657 RepID=A0A1H6R2U7_9BACT|nr:relaxase/mobilization nuclease domain-containing protein [Dyadobacter koreensis]SEI46110.1 Relaxase/Mobilisation nuclease domain-containing protein [Dyadobacter koreensis]
MVAVIHAGSSLRSALKYNERKVTEGVATLLDAGYFLQSAKQLSFQSKLSRLASRNALNGRVKVNTLHVSLNFSPDEKLSSDKLKAIAGSYLAKIGFQNQPYLLYEHHDSGHPHVHLVTTTIRADGSAINLHNIGRNQSEKARKALEKEYGLMPAQRQNPVKTELKPVDLKAVRYGEAETKKAIGIVLQSVIPSYHYSSLAELNAVLGQYNVTAEAGSQDSRIYKHRGLVYRVLDKDGAKTGVPVKASAFYFKPTLKALEKRFAAAEPERCRQKSRVKNAVDLALLNQTHSLESLGRALAKKGVRLVERKSGKGLVYGLTYIDMQTKCVYNGSYLGKNYSAKAVQERCQLKPEREKKVPESAPKSKQKYPHEPVVTAGFSKPVDQGLTDSPTGSTADKNLWEALMLPVSDPGYVPWQLRRKRKKKRKAAR